ncbi:AcrR family transcriptional regulator [Prauserella isguenensis]|uniref:AcrR family transcriptional regulator n=1 Tax=Prauserella isguenensis TaxID=1470180 RepID=A0A839S7N9_9PSEU|nr:TetR family transcriptional regulator [Prauserella isguenensis]MBB3053000.1 AcrR family transcriptional regulator [Prauserella isguenensis]
MSQREDLLAGARRCLVEKGYSRTTARDIATASGSHLASIGYHFGSKDALMNLAALEAQSEWGDVIERAVRASAGADPVQRLRVAMTELLASLPHQRELVVATTQAYAQAEFDDDIRGALAEASRQARTELAAMMLGRDTADLDADRADGIGAVVHAMIVGLAVQSVLAPGTLPDGDRVAAAIVELAGGAQSSSTGAG